MKRLFAAAVAFGMLGSGAQAATIGTFDVDPSLGVTSFSGVSGTFTTTPHRSNDLGALGNNWGNVFTGNNSELSHLAFQGPNPGPGDPNTVLTGTFANSIFNNTGIDIIAFETGDPPADANGNSVPANDPTNVETELLAASLDGSSGSFVDFSILGFLSPAEIGGTETRRGAYVLGLDLSDLGVADGASISSLVFGNTGAALDHDPDIIWGGGVTGAASAASVVPLPAGLPLMLTALTGLALLRRKRAG